MVATTCPSAFSAGGPGVSPTNLASQDRYPALDGFASGDVPGGHALSGAHTPSPHLELLADSRVPSIGASSPAKATIIQSSVVTDLASLSADLFTRRPRTWQDDPPDHPLSLAGLPGCELRLGSASFWH